MTYEKGKYYDFSVGKIKESTGGQKYIQLSDVQRDTYRVRPFDFQEEWETLPKKMKCYVDDVNDKGLPYLTQCREDVLKDRYREFGKKYTFTISEVKTDENNGSHYYSLSDAYGIKHRYYLSSDEEKKEPGDQIELIVKDIKSNRDKNSAFLVFTSKQQTQDNEISKKDDTHETIDILKESRFGQEGPTIEFKSSLIYPAGQVEPDIDKQMFTILRVIASFSNSVGGTLYIGVDDQGDVCGINDDIPLLNSSKNADKFKYQLNADGYENKIRTAVKEHMSREVNVNLNIKFCKDEDNPKLIYCAIEVPPSPEPIFIDNEHLYQRAGNMIQILKGTDLVNFINRRKANPLTPHVSFGPQSVGKEISKKEKDATPEPVYVAPLQNAKPVDEKIWRYFTLYNNGQWSYQKDKSTENDVKCEAPIMSSQQNELLVMSYDNGRVNVVNLKNVLRPVRSDGKRKLKKEKRRYANGFNQDCKLTNLFIAKKEDLILCVSLLNNNDEFTKLHIIGDIGINNSLDGKGNILINTKTGARPVSFSKINAIYKTHLSSLILKKSQTSGYLGFSRKNINFDGSFKVLDQILEIDKTTPTP
jgi:hypothetical protein